MVQRTPAATAALYEVDETAWLETTAELIRHGRLEAVELDILAEYLTDMAKRDRREVFSPEECPWDLDGALADRNEEAEP